ncbi:unnamed protein product [Eruca vesicaria subsp. sativa]|uniref:RING-type E3 ubiquitin transferase n=1 Tax=Eruca vesicaria subsp. sativa TaxID=29727 RepID=A0ABC8M4H0_ERUVS|nr:unnamed protein product [Eruca vesicaria subsp. sativa]
MEEEAIAGTRYWWCHMCTRTVDPLMESEIKCPFCASGFVEEMADEEEEEEDSPDGHDHRPNNNSLLAPILMQLMSDPDNQNDEAETENEAGGNDVDSQLQEILRRRRGRSSVSVMHESNGDGGGRERGRLIVVSAGSLSDDFIGPAFEALLQHLAEDDHNRYGTPPAQKDAVEALASVKIEEEARLQCSVCLDDFEIGVEAKEMPCKHRFHGECLLPWLELHCSCPVCRYELPSDETRTDSARTEPNGNDGGSESSSSTSSQGSENSHHSEQEEEEEESDDDGDGIEFAIPWLFTSLFPSSQGSSDPSTDTN